MMGAACFRQGEQQKQKLDYRKCNVFGDFMQTRSERLKSSEEGWNEERGESPRDGQWLDFTHHGESFAFIF